MSCYTYHNSQLSILNSQLYLLERVNHATDITEDAWQLAESVDVVVNAFSLVPLDERSGLVVINVETLLDCLCVVVRATALLTALHETSHQLVLRHVKLNHGSHLVSALCEHFLQSLSLRDSAWEAVEDYALVLLAEAIIHTCEDVDHQLVGDELSVVNEALGSLAKFCSVLNLTTENVACTAGRGGKA